MARSHGLHGNARGAGGREQGTGGLAVGLAVEHDQAQGLAARQRRADRRRAGQLAAAILMFGMLGVPVLHGGETAPGRPRLQVPARSTT